MEFEAMFKALDKDGSGEIDLQELTNFMKEKNLPANFVERWQAAFDLDRNGRISLNEFRSVLGLDPRRDYLRFFSKADPNRNGLVKLSDLKQVFKVEQAEDVYEMYFKSRIDEETISLQEYQSVMQL